MLFALLRPQVAGRRLAALIFDIAAVDHPRSIVAHGLTDTVGATWIERRMKAAREPSGEVPGSLL